MLEMTPAEVQNVAEAAARKAVAEMLLMLGVDASDPKAIKEMQRDFAYVRSWRESVVTVRSAGLKAAVTVLVTGALGAVLLYLQGRGH
jgi:TRAP-type mannitol/chloroaromatic compound transport system substrate-binding protein